MRKVVLQGKNLTILEEHKYEKKFPPPLFHKHLFLCPNEATTAA